MKGIALPIEVLVVVVVVVLVLLGVIAVWFTGWSPFASTAGVEGAKNIACKKLLLGQNCGVDPDQISVTGLDVNNLQELCDTYYGSGGSVDACKNVCGCGGGIVIGGPGPGPGPGPVGGTCTSCRWAQFSDCNNNVPCPTSPCSGFCRICTCTPSGCTSTGGATCPNDGFGFSFNNGDQACDSIFACNHYSP